MIKRYNNIISASKLDLKKLKKWEKEEYSKIRCDLELILEGQKMNQKDLRLGFIGLATQNSDLLKLNEKLNDQLKTVVKELNELKSKMKSHEEKMIQAMNYAEMVDKDGVVVIPAKVKKAGGTTIAINIPKT